MSFEEVYEYISVCLIFVVIIWNLDIGLVEVGVDYGLLVMFSVCISVWLL